MNSTPVNSQVIQGLFDRELPNSPALWAVLKGNHSGKALVDDIKNPSQCVVRTDAALTYFSSQTNHDFLGKAIEQFRRSGEVWLVWTDATTLEPPIVEDAEIINRMEFFGIKSGSKGLLNLRNKLPLNFIIQTIDAEMLQHCEWGEEMVFYSGSPDNFSLSVTSIDHACVASNTLSSNWLLSLVSFLSRAANRSHRSRRRLQVRTRSLSRNMHRCIVRYLVI